MKKIFSIFFCFMLFCSTNIFAADLDRLYDFETISATTKTIVSAQVDGELDQLVSGHNQQEDDIEIAGSFAGTKGSDTTASLEDVIKNDNTNDNLGHLQGCFLIREAADSLSVTAGTIAIGNNIYYESTKVTISDIDTTWSASSTTGGKDSGTTYNPGDIIYVFLTTTTGDPDGWQILLSESTSPTDVTVGTNARLIGAFLYINATDEINKTRHYRPWGIFGWDYIAGDDSGSVFWTITFGVTFDIAPIILTTGNGARAVADGTPTEPSWFSLSGELTSCIGISTTTNFRSYIWLVNNGNTQSIYNYGINFIAYGSWTI